MTSTTTTGTSIASGWPSTKPDSTRNLASTTAIGRPSAEVRLSFVQLKASHGDESENAVS